MAKNNPQVSNRVRIYTLLCKGWQRKDIMKSLNLSETRVREITSFYESNGLIKRVSDKPALYARNKTIRASAGLVENPHPYAYILPHNVSANFHQYGLLPRGLYKNGMVIIETRGHTAIFRKKTTTISLRHFRGESPDELLANAQKDLIGLADMYARKYSIALSLSKLTPNIDWADADEKRGEEISNEAQIAKRDWKIIDHARHKSKDGSGDPYEIDAIDGYPRRPTEHARRHYDLYSGGYERRMERTEKALERAAELLDRVVNGIEAIKLRMDMEVKK